MQFTKPEDLWTMSPRQFNEWRTENDIPELLKALASFLPFFDDWLAEQNLSVDTLKQIVPTSTIFKGVQVANEIEWRGILRLAPSEEVVLVRAQDDEILGNLLRPYSAAIADDRKQRRELRVEARFLPYFPWLKRRQRGRIRIKFDERNNQVADSFRYTLWSAPQLRKHSQAHLFGKIRVLKLGGVTLTGRVELGGRNLDFTDLDWLTLDQFSSNSRFALVTYSSVKQLRISNADFPFFGLDECVLQDSSYENCRVQDHYYRNLSAGRVVFQRCSIYRLSFRNTSVQPMFESTDIKSVSFEPVRRRGHSRANAETFRLLRVAAQANGLRYEASEFYYQERVQQRKAAWAPYRDEESRIPGYLGTLGEIIDDYRDGKLDKAAVRARLLRYAKFYAALLWPPRGLRFVGLKLRWFVSVLEWAVWGYGERPIRVGAAAVAVIFLYAGFYSLFPDAINAPGSPEVGWREYIYLSLTSFTSLVFSDIIPKRGVLQFVCMSEALVGALTAGLVVAGFSNRSRY